MSAAGFSALVVLTTAGGGLELRTLRRRLGWSKANATEVTRHARGARAGLPPPPRHDRRAAAVDLLPEGRSLVERLFPGHADRVRRLLRPRRGREALARRDLPKARRLRLDGLVDPLRPGAPVRQSFPALEEDDPRALARARRVPRVDPPPAGRRAVRLLRGPADRQRPPGLPPRAQPRVQGRVPALPDDARTPGAPQGRLGLPRPTGGARDREGARASSPRTDIERYGVAEFNARCRESVLRYIDEWNRLTERIGFWIDTDEAYYTLDDDYIESVWWSLKQVWETGPALRGSQGGSVLPALRHRALEPRGGAGLQGRGRPVGLRALPAARASRACRCWPGPPCPGRLCPTRRSRSTPRSPTCARAWATRR